MAGASIVFAQLCASAQAQPAQDQYTGAPVQVRAEASPADTWHKHIDPWQDPLRTRPAQLDQLLTVPLPPDLLTAPPASAQTASAPAEPVPAEWQCASHIGATVIDSTQHALRMLHATQPASPNGHAGNEASQLPQLDLPAAVGMALCHHPQLRTSWSQVALQAAQLGQARSAYLPQLSAGAARQRSQLGYSGATEAAQTTWGTRQQATLNWRLWDFGARSARVEAAHALLQAALLTQNATVHQVLGEVLSAYGELQTAQARLATQRSLLPLAERTVQAAERRQAGGAGSAVDLLHATAALARNRLELSRSQGDLDTAQAKLGYLIGLPPGTAYRTAAAESACSAHDTTTAPNTSETPDRCRDDPNQLLDRNLDDWLAYALAHHPAIAAARAQSQAARASLQAVQTEGLPTLDLGLAHYRNGRPDTTLAASRSRENVIGLTLTIPLFDGFAHTYKVRAAQAQVEQKAIEQQTAEQQVQQELVQLHAQARAALHNLQAARQLFAAMRQAAESTQRQWAQGAIDIVALNQSLADLQQAQLELARSQADWNRARLRLWLQPAAKPN